MDWQPNYPCETHLGDERTVAADCFRIGYAIMKTMTFVVVSLIAMLSPARLKAQGSGPWYEVSGGDWRVPAGVIADMRQKIDSVAREAVPRSTTKEMRTVVGDTVQYQGALDEKTRRRVVDLYGMCETEKTPAELRMRWQSTLDGGNCYYWARYDPTRRRFLYFYFNGAA